MVSCGLNYKVFLASLIIIFLFTLQIGEASAVTIQASVLIVPTLCKQHIDHFDHLFFADRDYEILVGTDANDLMVGLDNTSIFGKDGDDCLVGGHGNNIITGGQGNDVILGGSGTNIILVGNGNNMIVGGPGNDIIFFGRGNNVIDGGAGKNYCIGSVNNSVIVNCSVISDDMHGNDKNGKDRPGAKNILSDFILDQKFPGPHGKNRQIPPWMNNDLSWWAGGKISGDDLASVVKYYLNML